MRLFKKLTLTNVPWFKQQSFRLDQKGITVVLGKNLNTPTASTNAAGKSYFFSHLPEVLLDETVGGNRKDRGRKGLISLDLQVGSHTFTIVKDLAKSSNSKILKDGEDLGIKDAAERKAYIAKLVARSMEEYQVLDYLDSTNIRNHPLVKGDTASRRNFFTNFFSLNDTDVVRKLIKAELEDLKDKVTILSELRSQLKELKTAGDVTADSLKVGIAKANRKLKQANEDLAKLNDEIRFSAFVSANSKAIKLCDAQLEELKEGLIVKRLAKLKRILETAEAYEDYREELSLWKRQLAKRKVYLEANPECEDYEVQDVEKALVTAESKLAKVEEHNEQALAERQEDSDRKKSLIETTRLLEEELTQAKEGCCPTCSQPFNSRELVVKLRRKVKENAEEILALQEKTYELLDSSELRPKIARLKELAAKLRGKPSVAEKPEPPKGKPVADLDEVRSEFKHLNLLQDGYTELCGDPNYKAYLQGKKPITDVEAKQEVLLETSSAVHKQLRELELQLHEVTEAADRKAKLLARIRSLKEETQDLEAVQVLEKAYAAGSTGIKSLIIKTLCDRLTQQTNKYARLIFPEDYHFSFELDTQFHILVTRRHKKEEITTDVRKLSGAESSMFSLLLLIVLLTFVPKAKRSNLLVLDEPNANFGQEMTEAFIRFLPVLNKVIPHIIVITPHSEIDIPGARYFTVEKKGSRSRILEGR